MPVLGLLITASLLGCCVGYVVVQRPAEYYNYPKQHNSYQYQSYNYLPYNYGSYKYEPYSYQPNEHQSSYYDSYYYYYPISYDYPESHKSDVKPYLSYDEGQKLLQVYRLSRVIELFRKPPAKKLTSLDRLVQWLTKATLQEELAKLLYRVDGYEEVAELEGGPQKYDQNLFVNDIGRLLYAIQRALNALDLDDYDHGYHHQTHYQHQNYHYYDYSKDYYYKQSGYGGLPKELRRELRQLRDTANSMTVAQIEQELKHGAKAQAKEDLVADLLENLVGESESKSLMEEFIENYDVEVKGEEDENALDLSKVDKYVVVIDDGDEEQKAGKDDLEEEALDELAAALEHFLEEKKINKSQVVKGKEEVVPLAPVLEITTSTTTTTPTPPTTTEAVRDSWLGSLLGKGNLLPGQQAVDVSQPAVLIEPAATTENAWIYEEVAEKNSLDFDIDQRFQGVTSTEEPNSAAPVTHSAPLWLTGKDDQQKVESKESGDEIQDKKEQPNQLPEDKKEPEDVTEKTTDEAATATEEQAREIPVDEEKLQLVEEEVDGPARIDLLADLTEHKVKDSTPEPIPVDEQTDQPAEPGTPEPAAVDGDPITQSSPNVYEVHTEGVPAEAREEQPSLPTTAASEPDARPFVKEEVMKVLSLLEEANGFTELKDHVSDEDVNQLVEGLHGVEVGIRWTEMIGALQRLVTEKQLAGGERIVEVLEHWKAGEEGGQLDDGYFDRTYGKGDGVESRELVDGEEAELKANQGEDEKAESKELESDNGSGAVSEQTPFVDDVDNFFESEYGLNKTIANATNDEVKNETTVVAGNSSSEVLAEDRNPRLINVDGEPKEIDQSTSSPAEVEGSGSKSPQDEEETTDKLEETTLQPFPADEA